MTFLSKVGSFTAPASTGTATIAGVGFTPVAVIFWWADPQTTAGWSSTSTQVTINMGIGFATSPSNQGCIAGGGDTATDCVSETVTYDQRDSASAVIYDYDDWTAQAISLSATLTGFTSDGFTLNWATSTSGRIIHYLALGGTDITNAAVIPWQAQGSTGVQNVTVGFTPDFVMHIGIADTATLPVHFGEDGDILIGAMDGTGNQWARCHYGKGTTTTTTSTRYQLTNACIVGGQTATYKATGTMISSPLGFSLNWSACAAAARFFSLCLKGGGYNVGKWSKSTSAASDAVTAGLVTPAAVLVMSNAIATTAGSTAGIRWMVGASDATNNHVACYTEKNAVTTTVDSSYWDSTHSLYVTNNDTQTMQTAGTLGAFVSGGFTANYATHDTVATEFIFIAFGSFTGGWTQTTVPDVAAAAQTPQVDIGWAQTAVPDVQAAAIAPSVAVVSQNPVWAQTVTPNVSTAAFPPQVGIAVVQTAVPNVTTQAVAPAATTAGGAWWSQTVVPNVSTAAYPPVATTRGLRLLGSTPDQIRLRGKLIDRATLAKEEKDGKSVIRNKLRDESIILCLDLPTS